VNILHRAVTKFLSEGESATRAKHAKFLAHATSLSLSFLTNHYIALGTQCVKLERQCKELRERLCSHTLTVERFGCCYCVDIEHHDRAMQALEALERELLEEGLGFKRRMETYRTLCIANYEGDDGSRLDKAFLAAVPKPPKPKNIAPVFYGTGEELKPPTPPPPPKGSQGAPPSPPAPPRRPRKSPAELQEEKEQKKLEEEEKARKKKEKEEQEERKKKAWLREERAKKAAEGAPKDWSKMPIEDVLKFVKQPHNSWDVANVLMEDLGKSHEARKPIPPFRTVVGSR